MNAVRKHWLIAPLALACAAGSVFAQPELNEGYDPDTPGRRGQAGMTFLQVGASARAEGMGGAFSAVSGDPSAAFYNVAGMASISGTAAYVNITNWIAGMRMNHVVVAANTGMVTAGVTYLRMDYGDIVGTVIADNEQGFERIGNLDPSAWAAGVFVAVELTDRFSFGAQVKYAVQDLGSYSTYTFSSGGSYLPGASDNRVGTLAGDLGTQYETGLRGIAINMSLQNFAAPQRYIETDFDLPLTYRIGVSADAFEMLTGNKISAQNLDIHVDGVDSRDVRLDAAIGVEYRYDLSQALEGTSLALRAGRRAARDQEGWLSAGFGLVTKLAETQISFDYSYNDYGLGMDANRYSLSVVMP